MRLLEDIEDFCDINCERLARSVGSTRGQSLLDELRELELLGLWTDGEDEEVIRGMRRIREELMDMVPHSKSSTEYDRACSIEVVSSFSPSPPVRLLEVDTVYEDRCFADIESTSVVHSSHFRNSREGRLVL